MATKSNSNPAASSASLRDAFRRKGAPLFGAMNYRLMILGLVLLLVGNLLMIGKEDIYSFTKITLAPLVIALGYLVELGAILYRPKP
jgi:amino acid permease